MKRSLIITLTVLSFAACTKPNWVQDLQGKNPLKDSADVISVYFRFDTIINDYEVSGILYPFYDDKYGWSEYENGVRLFFHNLKTGKEYVWTDWDENHKCFMWLFMSRNVHDIVLEKDFKGFKNGESFVFNYDTAHSTYSSNTLMPFAEYQFYDVDFDGEDELILGFYAGGPKGGACFEIYDITDSVLVRKTPIEDPSYFSLDANSVIDAENKIIINRLSGSCCDWGTYAYKADDEGNYHMLYYTSTAFDKEGKVITLDTTFYSL